MLVSSRPSSLRAIFTTLVVVVALLGITAPAAHAAGTATWTGTDSELWSDPDNWGGVAPTAGADLVFPAGVTRTATVNDLAPGTSFGSITIAGAGYDISGTSLTLTGALSATYASGSSVLGIDAELGSATVATGGTLSLNGAVSGSPGLSVSGGGVLEVNGSASGPVSLAGGTLAGTGTLNGSGITATASSTVAPGHQNAPGILRYSANAGLTLPASSTFRVDLDGPTLGTGYDQLKLTSGSALFNPNGANLDIDLGYLPAVNTSFQIVSQAFGSPITGRFNGISQFGSVVAGPVTFSVGYFNSGIILTVVAVNVPTRTWDGGGATSNWSEAANWVGDVAPSLAAALVFPAGTSKLAPVNDLPGLKATSVTIASPGYELSGHALELLGTARATHSTGTSAIDLGLTVAAVRTVQVDAGGTLAITSQISGAGGLTKTSPGNLRLTSTSSSYTGATTVSGGRLTVDGTIATSSAVQVDSGATLTGSGTVPAASVSGNLIPRGLASGTLSLTSTSSMSVGLATGSNDRVDVTGTVQLSGPVLEPSLDHVPSVGDSFTIVDNDGSDAVSGTFADLPEGAYLIVDGVRLQISYVGGSGNDIVLTAALAPTTTTVSSSAASAVTGEPITFTATTSSEGTAVPGGTTRFLIDGDQVQAPTSVDAAGQATFTTDSLPTGDTTVTAEHVGATGFADSDGSRVQSVGAAATTTTLTIPAGPLLTGENITLTATVSPTAPGGGSPAGDVTFYDGNAELGTGAVNGSGAATYVASGLSVGAHSFTASYGGTTAHTSSTSTAVEGAVVKRPTTVQVTSTSPTKFGESVTFTATVTSGGTTVPGGTIRFLAGAEQVQAAAAVDANGQVTFTTDALPVGDTTITAEYAGTTVYADASGDRVHAVDKSETTTTVKVSAAALTAKVHAVGPGGGTPTGTVTFSVGDKPIGEAPLVDGVATLAASLATGKPIDVQATYSGSSNHLTSAAVTRRTDPTITARVQSSRAKSARGWYRTPVVVTFTCTAGSAALAQPCPKPVKVTRSARAIPVVGTATASDGGIAKVKVTVNIDRKAPSLRVKRNGNRLRCHAKDTLSGVASCKITKKNRAKGVVTWVARAKDRAGNVTTKRGKFKKR